MPRKDRLISGFLISQFVDRQTSCYQPSPHLCIMYNASTLLAYSRFLLFFSLTVLLGHTATAQGPISGFMAPKGSVDIALGYSQERFDTYLGPTGNEAIDLRTRAYQVFVEYTLEENMSIVATAPWLKTDATHQGWQDASIWLKYRNQRIERERAASSFFTAIGFSLPIGNYTTGERTSLGRRATVFQGRLAWQLDNQSGWFVHAQSGIDFQLAPTATAIWPVLVRAGYGHPYFYVETWLESVKSLSESLDNTLTAGAGSSWTRAGGTLYFPLRDWVGLHGGVAYILGGQNIGLSRRWQTGVVIKFRKKKIPTG